MISDTERLGIVAPHIMTEVKTGNRKSFDLARAIKPMKFSMADIEEIVRLWFTKSQPYLPSDATVEDTLEKFYGQLRRVRFTNASLESAIERARKAKLPFIAARDGDEVLARLAALNRELQRESGDKPYICPISVIQRELDLRSPSSAHYLQSVLEDEKVIECVDRGARHKTGQKGKPTFWRYKLPLSEA